MLAKFKNILFTAEKIEDMPGYKLYKGKNLYGCVFLDSMRFLVCIDPFEKDNCLSFDITNEEFHLIDYDIVTKEWLSEMMNLKQVDVKQLSEYLGGISIATVYRWLSGENPIPGTAKASLFQLFNK